MKLAQHHSLTCRLLVLNVLEGGRCHSPPLVLGQWGSGCLGFGSALRNPLFQYFMLVVPACKKGMGSMLTADSPAVGPWTVTSPAL